MRVICIDGKPSDERTGFYLPEFTELEAYKRQNDEVFYGVVGYDKSNQGENIWWHNRRFIPLSNKSETEMERNYQLKSQTV